MIILNPKKAITKTTFMNKKHFLLLAIIFCVTANKSMAQKKANRNSSTIDMAADTAKQIDIKEKLVQLALQNPLYEVADRRLSIADYELSKSKSKILGNVVLTGNLNEISAKGGEAASFFPRYNVGVGVPLDLFFTRSKEIKIAKENVGIAAAQKNQSYRDIRSEVLTRYEDFMMHKQMLEFQSQLTQDAYTTYLRNEKDFSDAIITQEEYNKAYKTWSEEQTKKIQLQRNYNVSKLELEKMIGITIDEVLATYNKK
jgi:outer membrane protein TolC